jgi:hypothetical protein
MQVEFSDLESCSQYDTTSCDEDNESYYYADEDAGSIASGGSLEPKRVIFSQEFSFEPLDSARFVNKSFNGYSKMKRVNPTFDENKPAAPKYLSSYPASTESSDERNQNVDVITAKLNELTKLVDSLVPEAHV